VTGRVLASKAQHAEVVRSYQRKYKIFVLRPIEDPEQRAQLHADYRLMDMSMPYYCLGFDPDDLQLEVDDVLVVPDARGDTYCVELSDHPK
jgi:hypothetical protein